MSILFRILVLSVCLAQFGHIDCQESEAMPYNQLSVDFLITALKKGDTNYYRNKLYEATVESLSKELDSDEKRLAFWINIYNAYVQHFLQSNPSSYDQKQKFFSKEQIKIFGKKISLDKIEHGIIRRSQWKYGFGNITNLFRPKFENKLRVDKRDYRIHFVLNCGAKSCPPVVILTPETLEKQLNMQTPAFLKKTTSYDPKKNEVQVSKLFGWFRGDFGNKKGIRKILSDHALIPKDSKPKISKKPYDWTIDLDNWTID